MREKFRSLFIFVFAVIMTCAAVSLKAIDKKIFSSVVKVFAVKSNPNYHQPWQNYPQTSGTGSGCIISGNRILTNAHVAGNSTFLMVRRQGDPKKYIAKVVNTGHECDLAVLKVEDPDFYKDREPIPIGTLPRLQDTVTVVGYPVGGDNISITEGVVSRIEPTYYSHSGRYLLTTQIDAAINPGNSGGPVIKDGKIVGIAFQGNFNQENMGFMVPAPVIKHFLKDIEDGSYSGFPDINISISRMENPDLRKWAKMKDNQTGILISYVSPEERKKGVFKVNDVIMAIDGSNISNDATVPFREDEVIFFGNIIWMKYIGDKCHFKLLRDGKVLDIDYVLGVGKSLVPARKFDTLPEYYILGGLVFVPLTQNYLDAWGGNWRKNAPRSLVWYAEKGEITKKQDQVVVLSTVLADDINVGYQNICYTAVKKLNGKKVKNLKSFINSIEKIKKGFIEITLDGDRIVVLDIKEARSATPVILKRYRVSADRKLLK